MSRRDKTASGHDSGLQTVDNFRENETSLKRKGDTSNLDPKLLGENAETVYRDKRGRKLDMLNEFMRQQASKEGLKHKIEEAQYSWGVGAVQKNQLQDKVREIEEMASEPFARAADDPKLDSLKKQEIRDGDPMAAYFEKLNRQNEEDGEADTATAARKSGKPKYKGPAPIPNRFKIPPGYRWDAIDRGNGFEKRLQIKLSDKMAFKEDEYKYSVSDL